MNQKPKTYKHAETVKKVMHEHGQGSFPAGMKNPAPAPKPMQMPAPVNPKKC